jgi:hypothetical protein
MNSYSAGAAANEPDLVAAISPVEIEPAKIHQIAQALEQLLATHRREVHTQDCSCAAAMLFQVLDDSHAFGAESGFAAHDF